MIALTGPVWMVVAACGVAAAVWWLPAPHAATVRLQDGGTAVRKIICFADSST